MTTVKRRSREAGQVLITLLLSMVVICGFAGFAIDIATMFRARRMVQTAADSAAIAGALELTNTGDPGSCTGNTGTATTGAICAAALADATRNGVANGVNGTTVAVNNGPTYGPHAGNSKYVEVIAIQPQPTLFMNLFGWRSMTVSARAVAYLGAGASQGCIYALNPTVSDAIFVNDSAGSLTTPGCAIYADSTSGTAVATKGANSAISGKFVGIVGGYSGNVTEGNNQPPTTGMVPVDDPLAWVTPPTIPTGSCISASSGALSPGFYCGGITGSATLSPGLYILQGDLSLTGNSSVTCPTCTAAPNTAGTGVTIYFTSNYGVSLGGTSSLTIVAASCTTSANPPLCGNAYNGIALWGKGTGGLQLQGNKSGFNITGVFYFPKAGVNFQGNSCSSSLYAAIVAQTVTFTGCTVLNGYPLTSGTFPITAATLEE